MGMQIDPRLSHRVHVTRFVDGFKVIAVPQAIWTPGLRDLKLSEQLK